MDSQSYYISKISLASLYNLLNKFVSIKSMFTQSSMVWSVITGYSQEDDVVSLLDKNEIDHSVLPADGVLYEIEYASDSIKQYAEIIASQFLTSGINNYYVNPIKAFDVKIYSEFIDDFNKTFSSICLSSSIFNITQFVGNLNKIKIHYEKELFSDDSEKYETSRIANYHYADYLSTKVVEGSKNKKMHTSNLSCFDCSKNDDILKIAS